jgi:thiamine-phosphate pyrophosphorylase
MLCETALAGGATVVQLREKKGSSADLVSLATRLLRLTSAHKVPLIINDRIDVALAVGADGVHLGQGDISAAVARRLIGPDMILGVSAKTVEQAQRAVEDGADYLGVGAVYGTATKTDATNIGLDGFSQVRQSVDLPVVAIGGIGLGERARAAMQAGADGVAVVSAVFDSADVQAATQSLVVDVAGSRATLPRGLLQIDINSEKF